jgi:hypothetical protein
MPRSKSESPNPNRNPVSITGTAIDQVRQQLMPQHLEGGVVAKKEGFPGCDRVDDPSADGSGLVRLSAKEQLAITATA